MTTLNRVDGVQIFGEGVLTTVKRIEGLLRLGKCV